MFQLWGYGHLDASFCVAALREALSRYGKPEIFNTDQGAQFTCEDFLAPLEEKGISISMTGKGRCQDIPAHRGFVWVV